MKALLQSLASAGNVDQWVTAQRLAVQTGELGPCFKPYVDHTERQPGEHM